MQETRLQDKSLWEKSQINRSDFFPAFLYVLEFECDNETQLIKSYHKGHNIS